MQVHTHANISHSSIGRLKFVGHYNITSHKKKAWYPDLMKVCHALQNMQHKSDVIIKNTGSVTQRFITGQFGGY
jgi:hypothetical protein